MCFESGGEWLKSARDWGVMSDSSSLGDHGTWQVICLPSIAVIYLYTTARWPAENVEGGRWRGGGGEVLIQQAGM